MSDEYESHTMTNAEYARIKSLAYDIARSNMDDIFDDEDHDEDGRRLFDLLLPEVDDTDDWRVAAADISDIAYEVASAVCWEMGGCDACGASRISDPDFCDDCVADMARKRANLTK